MFPFSNLAWSRNVSSSFGWEGELSISNCLGCSYKMQKITSERRVGNKILAPIYPSQAAHGEGDLAKAERNLGRTCLE